MGMAQFSGAEATTYRPSVSCCTHSVYGRIFDWLTRVRCARISCGWWEASFLLCNCTKATCTLAIVINGEYACEGVAAATSLCGAIGAFRKEWSERRKACADCRGSRARSSIARLAWTDLAWRWRLQSEQRARFVASEYKLRALCAAAPRNTRARVLRRQLCVAACMHSG